MLLNIGPKADGTVSELDEERLVEIGKWMVVNGEAIYGTKPYAFRTNESEEKIFCTEKDGIIYAFSFTWPVSGHLLLPAIEPSESDDSAQATRVTLLGSESAIAYEVIGKHKRRTLQITLPSSMPEGKHAWTFKLEGMRCL